MWFPYSYPRGVPPAPVLTKNNEENASNRSCGLSAKKALVKWMGLHMLPAKWGYCSTCNLLFHCYISPSFGWSTKNMSFLLLPNSSYSLNINWRLASHGTQAVSSLPGDQNQSVKQWFSARLALWGAAVGGPHHCLVAGRAEAAVRLEMANHLQTWIC